MMLKSVSLGVTDAVTIGTRSITIMVVQRNIGMSIVIVARARWNSKIHTKVYVQIGNQLMMLKSVSLGVTDAVTIGTRCITTMAVQRNIGMSIVIVARARWNSKIHAKEYVQIGNQLMMLKSVSLGVTDAVTIGTRSITIMVVQRNIGIIIVIVARARWNSKIHAKVYVQIGIQLMMLVSVSLGVTHA